MSLAHVRVCVLGSFEVEGVAYVGSRKARALLKVLALGREQPVPVDRLAACLWGDRLPQNVSREVAVLVSRLRSVLGTTRITHSEAGYVFSPDWLDLGAAVELAQTAAQHMVEHRFAEALAAAGSAIALFRGPLLADEPDSDWAEPHRLLASRLLSRLRHTSAQAALAIGRLDIATDVSQLQLDADPYDELALRNLMVARAGAGQTAAALADYASFRTLLSDELGTNPSRETDALHTAVLKGSPLPGLRTAISLVRSSPSEPAVLGLAGRSAEMQTLESALEAVRGQGMRMLLIQGERGMGKSRLLQEWCDSLSHRGLPVMMARARPWSASIPLQVIGDAISQYLSRLAPAQAEQLLGQEGRLLGAAVPTLQVRGLLEAGGEPEPSREMLFAGLLSVLERIVCDTPAVLAIDDLHLAHQATRDWLSYIRHYRGRLKLMVLVTWPEAEPVRLEGFDQTLRLGPLAVEVAAELVGPERASALHARTGGNPSFLLELAHSNSERTPDSLVAAASGSLQKLQDASGTVRAAAVLGTDLDLIAEVLELPHGTLLDHLERARQARILIHDSAQLRFSSELLREAILLSTPPAWQALLHRQAARILIRRRSPDFSQIASHAEAAKRLSV